MNLLIENYKEHGLKYFTPKRAWLWLRSKLRKVTKLKINESDAICFSEIVTYKSLTCPDCVQLGHCRVCKCPINELFSAMDVGCSDGKYPQFQEKRDWKTIRHEIVKLRFKQALKTYRNSKHWRQGWKEYKEKNNVFLTKFYG